LSAGDLECVPVGFAEIFERAFFGSFFFSLFGGVAGFSFFRVRFTPSRSAPRSFSCFNDGGVSFRFRFCSTPLDDGPFAFLFSTFLFCAECHYLFFGGVFWSLDLAVLTGLGTGFAFSGFCRSLFLFFRGHLFPLSLFPVFCSFGEPLAFTFFGFP